MVKSIKPFMWFLFSAGGMISAMLFPVLLIITGVIIPYELTGESVSSLQRIQHAVHNPIIKTIIFFVISLPFYHWAHRFRFTLIDMGLKPFSLMISTICYGGAVIGTIMTAFILWGI